MHVRYLSKAEYKSWDSLIHASPQYSIFNTTWLLDAFDKNYEVLAVVLSRLGSVNQYSCGSFHE